jgi:hypothetical protein
MTGGDGFIVMLSRAAPRRAASPHVARAPP